jgi:integrase
VRRLSRLPGRRGEKVLFRRSRRWRSWLRVIPQPEAAAAAELLARPEHDYRLAPPISQNTVHKLCGQMESIFRWAGPASKRCRHAADLFVGLDRDGRPRRLPWLDGPGKVEGRERIFTRAELLRWLEACRYATTPEIEDVAPADWWRALLRVIYYTGMRIGSVLAARYSWISIKDGDHWLEVPAATMKAKRPEAICLTAKTMAALDSIRRPGRDVIFAWPWPPCGSHRQLYQECERLQDLAGIPPERRFRFHAIRACAGDTLYDLDPQMAREALCHRDVRTTEQSYVRKSTRRRRRAAAAAMPELGGGQKTLFDLQ